jgi:hypothetical protein
MRKGIPSPAWTYLRRFAPANAKGHNIECFVPVRRDDGTTLKCGRAGATRALTVCS